MFCSFQNKIQNKGHRGRFETPKKEGFLRYLNASVKNGNKNHLRHYFLKILKVTLFLMLYLYVLSQKHYFKRFKSF